MDRPTRLKRLRFRAWHRGTKEADLLIGGYFDLLHETWNDEALDWFEGLLEEQDVDIMAWALGVQPVPAEWQSPMMERMRNTDYIPIER